MNKEIELKEIFDFFWNAKFTIIIFAVILAVASNIVMSRKNVTSYRIEVMVEFNFDGIDKGKYPDGSNFSYEFIKNIPFIKDALANLDLQQVSTEEVKNNIKIYPITPSDIVEITKTKLSDGEQYIYNPNKYTIIFSYGKIEEITSVDMASTLLDEILEQYRIWFDKRFIESTYIVETIGYIDPEEYEYIEILDVYREKIDMVQEFLAEKYEESPEFRSTESNYSFTDLSQSLGLLKSINMTKLEVFIQSNQVIRDRDAFLSASELQIAHNKLELDRMDKELDSLTVIMEEYMTLNNNQVLIDQVLFPSKEETSVQVYKNKYVEEVMNQYIDVSSQKNKLEKDNAYLESRLEQLKKQGETEDTETEANDTETEDAETKDAETEDTKSEDTKSEDAKNKKSKKVEEEAEEKLNQLISNINEWCDKANEVLQDYRKTILGNSVTLLSQAQFGKDSISKFIIIGGGLGAVVGFLVSFFIYQRTKKRKEEQTEN